MLCNDHTTKPESYKSYRNRVMGKHIYKIENQIAQIKSSSLKEEDKKLLKQKLIELINA
jgi:hypothetical protein